jgi:hypothetical protein
MSREAVCMFLTFDQTCLAFTGVDMMGSSTETNATWFLGHTHKPISYHLLSSSKGILRLFQALLEVPGIC